MYNISLKTYVKYLLFMLLVFFTLITLFDGMKVSEFDKSIEPMFSIIWHNLLLFLQWQILFILTPLYWIYETLILSFVIKTGIVTFGFEQALDKLWRHGIIEIPNMFLYQILSLRLLYFWWKNKSFATIKNYFFDNKKIYLVSACLILFAGIIEGIKW